MKKKLVIELTECDLEEFKGVVYNNESVKWSYIIDGVGDVEVEFISEDESIQRNQ